MFACLKARATSAARLKPRAIAILALWLATLRVAAAASLFDPALHFRQLPTEHFVIYFHQGEEPIARRLAAIAEETWRAMRQPLRITPPPRTHVVLVDQTDLANGSATPIPYNTIVVTAAWPAGVEFIGNVDDWLRLVFTHEFTHVVHLDRSGGWARVVRSVFGRSVLAFPNLFLPTWQIEGLATYEESVLTGEGRLHAGDFTAVLRQAARDRDLEPLDRVNGGLTDWPGGNAPYAYGLGFHEYLADRFGDETLAALADATARRVPYTQSYAFRYVFGEPLGQLWKDYEQHLADATRTPAGAADSSRRLTHHGFVVSGPRFDRFACDGCPPQIVYSLQTPHAFPTLNRVTLDGSAARVLTTRYLGSTTGVGEKTLYFDQQERRRNVALYSDLYALDRTTGRVRQVTSEARLMDPDLSPDGRTIAAVQDNRGRRDLVLVRLPGVTIEPIVSAPDTEFNAPRWSPDGATIAVERHRVGAMSDVVLVDVAAARIRTIASIPGARIVTPAWRGDGAALVVAVAPADEPFNLVEFPLDPAAPPRQLTHTTGGATWPDVSSDGRTLVFVGYTTEGFDLFTMPYPERAPAWIPPAPTERSTTAPAAISASDTRYSPFGTLAPTSWSPVIASDANQVRIGAAIAGVDVLGYHAYAASATWLTTAPADAPRPSAATPDWNVYYAYDRWRPTLWAAASNDTSFFAGPATDAGAPSNATLRARSFEAGVLLPIQHVRASHAAVVSVISERDDYTFAACCDQNRSVNRTAVRGAWATTTTHTYGYSISPEAGITAGATAERVPNAFGSAGEATAVTADVRAYVPGAGPHHVIAVRVAAGASTGDVDVRRSFHLGGAGPDASPIDFGRDAISLLRGFDADTFAGRHVALLNADYRFPVARPERGIGTWPIFFHTIHAAVFADAGQTWTRTFRTSAMKTSFGGEASANLVAGYVFPFTATIGAAWGHDGSGLVRDRATVYARVGTAF